MSNKPKILVIRLSAMGDIVLTTPVIRALNQQLKAKIDFLTKPQYVSLLEGNTYINRIFSLNDKVDFLQKNKYDYVVDLQNNLRSWKIRNKIQTKSFVFNKKSLRRYLLIYFGIDLLKNHVVDRYFATVASLNVVNDNQGLDFNVSSSIKPEFNTSQSYIAWCIGGTHNPKKLSAKQITQVVSKLKIPVVLLGGNNDLDIAKEIINNVECKSVYNFCGKLSVQESSYLIKKSKMLLTNDTGMMHIASALKMPIISFWGCTKPSLGFTPYMTDPSSIKIISKRSAKPCSKHGRHCKYGKNGCIKEIDPQLIYDSVLSLLK
ncbi:MAG: glycosyltransferase family 9 protein [Bacteroidota bacterium]|nr:glycosyltransferase family 9 protein [Bacteroidota bacterium]